MCPGEGGLDRARDRAHDPLRGLRLPGQGADRRFARQPDHHRHARSMKERQLVEKIQIVPKRLAEADPGIDEEVLAGYALPFRTPSSSASSMSKTSSATSS